MCCRTKLADVQLIDTQLSGIWLNGGSLLLYLCILPGMAYLCKVLGE